MKSSNTTLSKFLTNGFLMLVTAFCGAVYAQQPPRVDAPPPQSEPDPLNMKGKGGTMSINSLPEQINQHAKKRLLEVQEKGFVTVSDVVVDKFTVEGFANYFQPLDTLQPNLAVTLSGIGGTPFEKMEYHGAIPQTRTPDGAWAGISRIFSLPNRAVIRLYEWNFVAAGGGALLQDEFINESVNGNPAILLVQKTSKGSAVTTLSWVSGAKYYTITASGHVRGKSSNNQLVQYATSLK